MSEPSSSEPQSTIYVLYNANGSILGKVKYAYEKLTCSKEGPDPCAACTMTHGGLKLDESKEWKATKTQIPAQVKQLHLDELDSKLRDYIRAQGVSTPAVLGSGPDGTLQSLLLSEDLAKVSKDHQAFLELLFNRAQMKGIPLEQQPRL